MRKKITIIGAGNVGTTTAQLIAERNLADVVLIDIVEGIPQGKALDILEACPLWKSGAGVTGTNDYADTAGSDIIVITAGLARKPGMSRDDLLQANAKIIHDVTDRASAVSPDSIIIVVTNPMDAMAHVALSASGFPHKRVIGMGGVLDSSRMRTFIASELRTSPADVEAMVLGGHGDLMVPLMAMATAEGKSVTELLSESALNSIIKRTRNGGAEIVGLLKTGSAYYAPAASTVDMIEAIIGNKDAVLPCSVYLNGEYGIEGVYVGVPVKLDESGLSGVVEYQLSDEDMSALRASADAVRGLIAKLDL